MAEFKEELVINALHPDKAEVGKEYWYSDSVVWLKRKIENNEPHATLKNFRSPYFEVNGNEDCGNKYLLLYPYEEPPKKRMTNRMLAEWCAKGNGEYSYKDSGELNYTDYSYNIGKDENEDVKDVIQIRPWDSEEWIEPTEEIFLRDCRGVEV